MLAKQTAVKGWDITSAQPVPPKERLRASRTPTPGAEEAQHRIDATPPGTAFAAKPAAVERWLQQEADVVDDDNPAELMERARQHFQRSILADASEQNSSGSCGSPAASESAVMTGGCTPPARWELKSKPSTIERWQREQAKFSESGNDMSQASQCLTALRIASALEHLDLFPSKSPSWCDSDVEDFDSGAMSPCDALARLAAPIAKGCTADWFVDGR